MHTHSFRLFLFISVLVLAGLACGGGSKATDAPIALPVQPSRPPTEIPPTEPTQPQIKLDNVQRVEEGGYTYQPAPGYQVESGLGIVSMLAEGADPDFGPSISLFGGPPDAGATAQSMLDQLKGTEDSTLSEPASIMIGGYEGLAADIVIKRNDINIYGRIAAVVTPEVQFVALAGAPWEHWEGELEPLFAAVLDSVTFFTPVEMVLPTEAPTQTPTQTPAAAASDLGYAVHQWAVTATASSQFADSGWNASQAAGEPNVPACADDTRAWASLSSSTVEWLEVTYNTPVTPAQVNIYETYNPGQIVKVELLDVYGSYHQVYTAEPQLKECPAVLTIDLPSVDYQAISVRITLDQSRVEDWGEIDAVELVGYSDASAAFDPANLEVIYDSPSGLPMLPDAQVVSSSAENLLYNTSADLPTLQGFYLTNLPISGWFLDLDENGKCLDNDRCMGWHGGYDETSTTFFFISGEHAYLTLNFVQDGSLWQVIALIDPDYE